MLFLTWLRPRYKIPEFFTISPDLTSTLTVCRQNRGDPSSVYRNYGALQVLQKQSFWFRLEPPTRRSQSKSAHKCIPYNNGCVQNFIQIGWDLAVGGSKTCFGVKTENGQAYAWPLITATLGQRKTPSSIVVLIYGVGRKHLITGPIAQR